MSDTVKTVATFWDPIEADLARNYLKSRGMPVVLEGAESVSMAWLLTNAVGGIKLQVREEDADTALAILAEGAPAGPPASAQPGEEISSASEVEPFDERGAEDAAESEPALSRREQNADRAFRGAVLGLLFIPLQMYVFWLLLKVFLSDEPLRPDKRRNAILAGIINLPMVFGFCLFFRAILLA